MSVSALRIHPSQLGHQVPANSRRQHLPAHHPALIHFAAAPGQMAVAGDPDAIIDQLDDDIGHENIVHRDGFGHGRLAIFSAREVST